MKSVKFTLFIFLAAAFAACSKDDELVTQNISGGKIGIAATKEPVTITGWEGGYDWATSDSASYIIYQHVRLTSEIKQDMPASAAILVWAKNITTDKGGIISSPQILPLSVTPYEVRPAYNNYWYYIPAEGKVTVKFRTDKYLYTEDPAPVPNGNVQFKYFIIPGSVLKEHGYTTATVTRLTYEQLTGEFGE